ncbi:MAG: hypothetical protein U1E76_07285 [Planctomycetota bacterium]
MASFENLPSNDDPEEWANWLKATFGAAWLRKLNLLLFEKLGELRKDARAPQLPLRKQPSRVPDPQSPASERAAFFARIAPLLGKTLVLVQGRRGRLTLVIEAAHPGHVVRATVRHADRKTVLGRMQVMGRGAELLAVLWLNRRDAMLSKSATWKVRAKNLASAIGSHSDPVRGSITRTQQRLRAELQKWDEGLLCGDDGAQGFGLPGIDLDQQMDAGG